MGKLLTNKGPLTPSQFQDSVSISSAQTVGSHGISRRCYDSHDSLVREGFLPSRVTQCGGREEREGDEDEAGARHIGLCATGKLDDKNMWRFACCYNIH